MKAATLFDDRPCQLGEGPLWHPERHELFWTDILARKVLSRAGDKARAWQFAEMPSAIGWLDRDTLIVATDAALVRLTLASGEQEVIAPLEPDLPSNRSNDGRADPYGGFWVGTVETVQSKATGSFWRYYRGELRQLFSPIMVTNGLCFSPDGLWAYFTDTPTHVIQRVALSEKDGWPIGEPEVHIDLRSSGIYPDGAVVAADGTMWSAEWGNGRVAQYGTDGRMLDTVAVPAAQSTCPAFGGTDLTTLYCTSAAAGDSNADARAGCTFAFDGMGPGQAEHRVIL